MEYFSDVGEGYILRDTKNQKNFAYINISVHQRTSDGERAN